MAVLEMQCFGVLEPLCGRDSKLAVSAFPLRVDAALEQLAATVPGVGDVLPYVACAVGDQIVARDHELHAGDVLALLPPVSGG